MMVDAKQQLMSAAQAISTAVMVLRMELSTMEAFLKEARDMENFGSITNPTLYRNAERRAFSAVVEPLFRAAVDFVRAHDAQIAASKDALEKVA